MNPRHFQILSAICDLPTAPFCEQHVIAWLLQWAALHPQIATRRDKAGNVYLEYRRGPARKNPLVLEAHMDHPGFVLTRQKRDGTLEAHFRGGVKPSHFKNAAVQFWLPASGADTPVGRTASTPPLPQLPITNYQLPPSPTGTWLPTHVLSVKTVPHHRHLKVHLAAPKNKQKLPPNTLGMWQLPNARAKNARFSARVCDDLAGVAAMICLLEELISQKIPAHVIALCSRAEEVGFAGVLAVCEHRWLPKNSPVIGLETSKAFPTSPQGAGPIIRVGDRTGIFSAGLTHFLTQAAGYIADDLPAFKYQRKLMDGGTCNSTAFAAYGYDAAALCIALGNYHNMSVTGGIASETIHLGDFEGLVQLLVEITRRIRTYRPGLAPVRQRLSKMHHAEQTHLLYPH